MFEKLVEVICNYVEVEPENVHMDSRFMEDLGFTSFDFMSMLGELEDEFDLQSIAAVEARHKKAFLNLARQARLLFPGCLPLSSGTCSLCRKCTYPDRPCRFPGKRLSSMEAFGLLVSDVCQKSGLPYYYGPKTITFTACILTD